MPDTDINDARIPVTLDDSEAFTRSAITALLRAPLPTLLTIENRSFRVSGVTAENRTDVAISWPNGSARFSVRLIASTAERTSNTLDAGHRLGIQVLSESGMKEIAWTCMEWFVRDAIRAGELLVPVSFMNAFIERGASDDLGGTSNAEMGRRSREICGRSGLGSEVRAIVGTYDLENRTWSPDATTVLKNLLSLVLIKTSVRDRGRGALIEGEPPLPILFAPLPRVVPSPHASSDRLSGVHLWFGSGAKQVDGVRDVLRFIETSSPTTPELETWLRTQGELEHSRIDIYTRPLRQLGLAMRANNDHWQITETGAEFIESESADLLFQSFVANYIGFEETLAFYGRHPEGPPEALLDDLNRRLGMQWTKTAQPSRRAYWLRSMELLEGWRGTWRLSDKGRAVFDALPPALKQDLEPARTAVEDDDDDLEAEGEPQPTRLSADDVPLADLKVDSRLIAKCVAALNAGKHLLLIGPPGTGKSAIGCAIARHAADVYGLAAPTFATASADWTAYDTIGGWAQKSDHSLAFRPGVLTRALRERRWLVLDELNRADVDKCLGEAFTVLAGGEAETAFSHEDGSVVRIGPGSPYDPGTWFRLIATMNVRDKATLFQLSYALLRRFAVIEVPVPNDALLRTIALEDASRAHIENRFAELAARAFTRDEGLGDIVSLGPAMLRDVLRYAKERGVSGVAIAEGLELFVLPQLEGIETGEAKRARPKLRALFADDAAARDHVLACFDACFPHVRFDA